MVKFVAVKLPALIGGATQRGLFPDAPFADALAKVGDGEFVTVEVKHVRNPKRLRFYWALMNVVWGNLENELHPKVEDFSDAIKVMAGHRERFWIPPGVVLEDGQVVGPSGIWGYRPKSIAFDNLEEAEFAKFIDRVVDLIVKWFLPTVSAAQLYKQVEEMCGIKPWWEKEAAR